MDKKQKKICIMAGWMIIAVVTVVFGFTQAELPRAAYIMLWLCGLCLSYIPAGKGVLEQ